MTWYRLKADETLKTLGVDQKAGLSDTQADERLAEFGANELAHEQKASVMHLLLGQFKNPLIIILMVGAFLSFYIGHTVDAVAILVIVLINIMIGFIQELNMQKSMDSLNDMSSPMALVIRNGQWEKIPAHTLVPGDILKLDTGTIGGTGYQTDGLRAVLFFVTRPQFLSNIEFLDWHPALKLREIDAIKESENVGE